MRRLAYYNIQKSSGVTKPELRPLGDEEFSAPI